MPFLLEIIQKNVNLGILVFFLFISLVSGIIYYLLHLWRGVDMNLPSFLGFSFFIFSLVFAMLGFHWGLGGPFYAKDLPSWTNLRYSLQIILFFFFLSLYIFWKPLSLWMEENPLFLGWASWLDSFDSLKNFSVFFLEKIGNPGSKAFIYFSPVDFILRSLLPLTQSFLFLLWAWGNLSLHYSLLLLPLSFLSLVYGIFFFYVNFFLRNNFLGLQSLILVSHPLSPSSHPFLSEENTSHLLFSLTPRALELGYHPHNSQHLFSLWFRMARARYLFSQLLSFTPWIHFFRLLSWLLLSLSFSLDSPTEISSFLQNNPLSWISRFGGNRTPGIPIHFKHDLHWLSSLEGKRLENKYNYKHPHPVGGDTSLRQDGKTEIDVSVTHGKPPGSIEAGVIDSAGIPQEISIIPFPPGVVVENKDLTPMNASLEGNMAWDQAMDKAKCERNSMVYSSLSSPASNSSANGNSSSSNSSTSSSVTSNTNSLAYKNALSHPLLKNNSSGNPPSNSGSDPSQFMP